MQVDRCLHDEMKQSRWALQFLRIWLTTRTKALETKERDRTWNKPTYLPMCPSEQIFLRGPPFYRAPTFAWNPAQIHRERGSTSCLPVLCQVSTRAIHPLYRTYRTSPIREASYGPALFRGSRLRGKGE